MSAAYLGGEAARLRPAADSVMSSVDGATAARTLIVSMRSGCAPADLLLEGIEQAQAGGDREYVRAFVRTLQKTLERTV